MPATVGWLCRAARSYPRLAGRTSGAVITMSPMDIRRADDGRRRGHPADLQHRGDRLDGDPRPRAAHRPRSRRPGWSPTPASIPSSSPTTAARWSASPPCRPTGRAPATRPPSRTRSTSRADHRGKGVGRALLSEAVVMARTHGFHSVVARVERRPAGLGRAPPGLRFRLRRHRARDRPQVRPLDRRRHLATPALTAAPATAARPSPRAAPARESPPRLGCAAPCGP